MNKEELKQKAIDFEKNWFDEDIAISDLLIEFATEVTKELEAQSEKMKCCQNCRKFNNLSYDCTCAEVCNEWELRR